MNEVINVHDFSHTLYRWAYDYHNSVNLLNDKYPGLQMFAVKYNNACVAFELIVKSHIAYSNHFTSIDELDKLLKNQYGHGILLLAKYTIRDIGLQIDQHTLDKIKLIDKYYSKNIFRYPPYEPRKSMLDHKQLLDSINDLRCITGILLVVVHEKANAFILS